jgi:hypothetical protein
MIRFNKIFVDSRYNIDYIKTRWQANLEKLLAHYPDEESRKFPKEMFTYKA